jgi:hypothetical protein
MVLWAQHDQEPVAGLLRGMYQALQDDFIPLYEQVVSLDGRRFRPPFTAPTRSPIPVPLTPPSLAP